MRRLPLAAKALALALILSPCFAAGDDDLTVLKPGAGGPPPNKSLYAFLEAQAKRHFDDRRKAIAALKTPRDIEARRADLRAKISRAMGELPSEKSPLNAKTVGSASRDGYTVERVIYESRPGHHVTATLYLPNGPRPCPGVLVPCGHSDNGKAAEFYQRACILMARNGLAVLCYDPIGQGERVQLLNAEGKPAVGGGTTEHTLLGAGALLVGRSAAGYRVWDGIRSLDYLAGRPEVDPNRLGCTGNSGGGTLTAYLMALDDRISVASPSCYITSLERLFATIGPQDAEQNLTGQVALGIEHADFVTARAPKPTLLSVGTRDFFDIDGSWVTFREVKKIYGALGYGERVDLFESDEPHGWTKPRRESSARWMRRWLLGKDEPTVEPDFPVAADKDLLCTETGQVVTAFHDRIAFDFNTERASELERQRAERFAKRTVGELRKEARDRLAIPEPQSILVSNHRHLDRDGYTIDLWTLGTEPGAVVIERLFRPSSPAEDRPFVVYVGADPSLAAPGGPIEKRVKAGEVVAMIEPRGTGETAPGKADSARTGYVGADAKEAFLALHLNRPLIGQRVYDVLQSLRALKFPDQVPADFHMIGVGALGPVVLHAAALDDRISVVEIEGAILSWSSVVRTPVSRGQLANTVPGVLEAYDLPDLAAAIAPRALTIRRPVDPSGQPVAPGDAASALAATRASYREWKAEDRLRIVP
jgi:dienelactone hydrolase